MHRLEEHTPSSVYPLLIMILCVSVCIYRGDCHHHQRPFPSTSQEVPEEEGGTGGSRLCSLLSVWIAKCYSGELLVLWAIHIYCSSLCIWKLIPILKLTLTFLKHVCYLKVYIINILSLDEGRVYHYSRSVNCYRNIAMRNLTHWRGSVKRK